MESTRQAAPRLGVGYTRYSTEEQGSTAEQLAINQSIAAGHGVVLTQTFSDEGVSRTLSDRPGLRALFAHLEANRDIRFLVVNELERITAGVGQRQQITAFCKRLDITLVTEDAGAIDPHDEDAMYDADVRAVNAKGEVLKVRRRTRRNLHAKVLNGSTVAMRPPFGVRMKPLTVDGVELPSGMPAFIGGRKVRSGQPEIHPAEHPWLLQIFAWADDGVSSDEIARRLTNANVPTKTGKDTWPANSVNGILDNPFYKGELVWGRQKVLRDENGKPYLERRAEDDPGRIVRESPLGALVAPEVWDRVNRRRMAARGQRHMAKRVTPPSVLDGVVFCARCGHRMYARVDNPGRYARQRIRFYCPGSRPGMTAREGFEPCKKVNTMLADNIVAGLAATTTRGGRTIEVTVSRGRASESEQAAERRRLNAVIAESQQELSTAKRLAIKGLLDDADLASVTSETAQSVRQAQLALTCLASADGAQDVPFTGTIADRFAELSAALADEDAPVALRQTLLRDFGVTRIYVDNPRVRVQLL